MIYIDKKISEEPTALKEYIDSQTANQLTLAYRDMPKDAVRAALLKIQGGLCCYCMNRIGKDNSSIEHFLPQTQAENYQVAFHNLFLACRYPVGRHRDDQHCDKAKADKLIPNYFSSRNCASYFAYSQSNGEILPRILTTKGEPDWERQKKFTSIQDCQQKHSQLSSTQHMVLATIATLNLNSKLLTAQRKICINSLLPMLKDADHAKLVKMREKTETRQKNNLWKRFVGIELYFLDWRMHYLQK